MTATRVLYQRESIFLILWSFNTFGCRHRWGSKGVAYQLYNARCSAPLAFKHKAAILDSFRRLGVSTTQSLLAVDGHWVHWWAQSGIPITDIENTIIRIGGSLKTRGVLSPDLFNDIVIVSSMNVFYGDNVRAMCENCESNATWAGLRSEWTCELMFRRRLRPLVCVMDTSSTATVVEKTQV